MNKPASVFFTGMDSFDAEQLSTLFQDANRRTGSHWQLASDIDSAEVLIIDVDTLYGHMTWLRSQNSDQTIVALTAGTAAEADHLLQRPVTMDAMRRLLHDLRSRSDVAVPAPADASPMTASSTPPAEPEIATEESRASRAPIDETPALTPATPAPVPLAANGAATTAPTSLEASSSDSSETHAPPQLKLIDALLAGNIGDGPQVLELPGLQPLALDMTKKVFPCGNGIKSYLPHTKVAVDAKAWKPLPDSEFKAMEKNLGGTQPVGRLVWLAALGGSDGVIHGAAADARYRLSKWPQIEREFPRHFRIATTMMKGFLTPDQIAEQSGASVAEVNEFIVASMVSGHAETEAKTAPAEPTPANPRSLLERLRGVR